MSEVRMDELPSGDVETIIARRFPELTPVSAIYLGAGMDSIAFEINSKWVFRFPRRPEVEAQMLVERAILPALAPLLSIAIPVFSYDGRPGRDFPMHFAGYEKLPGIPAMEFGRTRASGRAGGPLLAVETGPSRTALPKLAPQLGRFLTQLHRFPVEDAARLGARTTHIEGDFEHVRESALATLPVIRNHITARHAGRLARFLSSAAPVPAAPWPLTLTHHDLAAEHILVDRSGLRVTGVIDWGDIAIADPTIDFIGLFAWGGTPFVRAVLQHYEGVVDGRVLERVRPWAIFRSVQDIQFGAEHDQPAVVALAIRAFDRELTD